MQVRFNTAHNLQEIGLLDWMRWCIEISKDSIHIFSMHPSILLLGTKPVGILHFLHSYPDDDQFQTILQYHYDYEGRTSPV